MDISKIDRNFKIEHHIDEENVVLYDVRSEPFDLYGLYNPTEEADFKRMPDEIAKNVNEGVASLYLNTAGGRVRFATDSRYVAIKAEMPSLTHFSHMPFSGTSGFDLYLDDPVSDSTRYVKSYFADMRATEGFEGKVSFSDRKMRYFTLNFPTYNSVKNLWIGLEDDATVDHGLSYKPLAPVVYYGSSITQGGCSSRPGNAYQAIVSRRMNMDFLNLGFSGSGKGEDLILDYMAGLNMSVFVSDYDHNAPTVEHLKNTHCKLYEKIRAAHPDIPYIMLSKPDFLGNVFHNSERRDVIIDTFRYAKERGDKNVYWIDGESIFRGPYAQLCTVDGCHPTDIGFALMADAVEHEIRTAFTQRYL
ncbi:MAG: hypothetical protein E7643_07305 [Ruminococcaceae bacterium]|nr:hypothetical protein [Oscillospiraceae bacterium]